jgi:hypothetical protein
VVTACVSDKPIGVIFGIFTAVSLEPLLVASCRRRVGRYAAWPVPRRTATQTHHPAFRPSSQYRAPWPISVSAPDLP